jgi:hypothetical protein
MTASDLLSPFAGNSNEWLKEGMFYSLGCASLSHLGLYPDMPNLPEQDSLPIPTLERGTGGE